MIGWQVRRNVVLLSSEVVLKSSWKMYELIFEFPETSSIEKCQKTSRKCFSHKVISYFLRKRQWLMAS